MSQREDDVLDPGAHRQEPDGDKRLAEEPEEQARQAARAYFRSAPPYRIEFEQDGRVSLRRKRYSFWGDPDPARATAWDVLSHHPSLEEAERHLRHITTPAVHCDSRGRLAPPPASAEAPVDWCVREEDG